MTWKEFKDWVDAQGVKDGDKIGFLELSDPAHLFPGLYRATYDERDGWDIS